jgi:hypothetical protein
MDDRPAEAGRFSVLVIVVDRMPIAGEGGE